MRGERVLVLFESGRGGDTALGRELALERLAGAGVGATYKLLVEGKGPSLPEFASDREFDLVLLPGRRPLLGGRRHPQAARVSRACGVAVRVVDGVAAGS